MKYEEWIEYEEIRLAEKKSKVQEKMNGAQRKVNNLGLGARIEAGYRERCLVEVLLQQQALIDALRAQVSSLHAHSVVN